jgi:hypothetical protein
MKTIILISTIHKEIGTCNAEELSKIIEKLTPDVIFLEALEETYSEYKKYLFSSFGVYDKKLEVKAIQIYNHKASFVYVPVLDAGASDAFNKKFNVIGNNSEFQKLIDSYNILAHSGGFKFINSSESTKFQEEMRKLEALYLIGSEIERDFNDSKNSYENNMIQNIYSFCKDNHFNTSIFMCGVAHRKSIIEKIENFISKNEELNLNWVFYAD